MKVLLNVSRDLVYQVGTWVDCEGIKLEEIADGSFDLVITSDVARMREADASLAEVLERARKGTAAS